jgi:hypothetical protein
MFEKCALSEPATLLITNVKHGKATVGSRIIW